MLSINLMAKGLSLGLGGVWSDKLNAVYRADWARV
jgi:hypothetical protein